MEADGAAIRPALLAHARTLAADAAAAEVVAALRERGLPSILLKGPVLRSWLYADSERDYVDADLLVPVAEIPAAEGVLRELGFVRVEENLPRRERIRLHSRPWSRPRDLANIDLHRTLFGVGVSPERTWKEVASRAESMSVAGQELHVLSPETRALLVAIHAEQHQEHAGKALEDLERAIDQVSLETWRDAAELAERLDATPTMALGLALLPQGADLARRLSIVSPELARLATARGSLAPVALGFERLARTPGAVGKLRVVLRELVPPRDFMWWWSPLARRGPLGMALAYLWRPLWLLALALPSLVAWMRHREAAG